MRLDRARAEAAVSTIAEELGVGVVEAAWRIKDAVDRQTSAEIASHLSAARAGAASDSTLLLYGGAGPVHGGGILAHVGARQAIMTRTASVFSAFSSASMDVLHQYPVPTSEAIGSDAAHWASTIADALPERIARAERDMRGEGFAAGSLRYRLHALGQDPEGRMVSIRVPLESDAAAAAAELHRRLGAASADVRLLALEASAGVPHHEPTAEPLGDEDAAEAIVDEREAYWGPGVGLATAPVYARDRLRPGNALDGPALVQGSDTTIVVPPGQRLTVDEWNDDILTISEGGAR